MGLSSGTSGSNKYIPFPEEQFQTYRRFTNHCFFNAFRSLDNYTLLSENILVTAGGSSREVRDNGIIIGHGSGLATIRAPRFSRKLVRPTLDILEMHDPEAKIRATVEQSIELDIRALTGVPNSVVPLLEALLELACERGVEAQYATDIWPSLALYAYSGSPVDLFETRIRELLGPDVPMYEIYSSTESPVAFQYELGQPGLLLDLSVGVFEFLPIDAPLTAPRLGAHELVVGQTYEICVTTPAGLFAYALRDRIEVLSTDPILIRFAGRTREEINLGVERLSLSFIRKCLVEASSATGVRVGQFFVCPTAERADVGLTHHWHVELSEGATQADAERLIAETDARLAAGNLGYEGSREDDIVLRRPEVTRLRPGTIESFVFDTLTYGQSKIVNLYSNRDVPEKIRQYAAARGAILS